MEFNEDLEQFIFEFNGLIFAWDDNAHLNFIVEFMMPYITKVFGTFSFDEIKEKLGKPVIDYENGRVNYFEQSFDDTHIFTFEFSDDEFEDLQYFSIDG